MSRAQVVDWDPGRAPLFHRDLRDVGFSFKDFIYLFERERERDSQQDREPKQENGRGRSRLPAEDPDVGLDPGTPGSGPEPKAEA